MTTKKIIMSIVMLGGILLALPFSLAHMEGGIDREVNGYIIDIGYDPNPLVALSPASLSIGLFNATTKNAAIVSKAWLRLSTEDGVVHAGTYLPENGVVPLRLTFPKGGEYTLAVRFYEDGNPKAVASADVPITVNGAAARGSIFSNAWGVLFLLSGMLVAGIIGYVIGVA